MINQINDVSISDLRKIMYEQSNVDRLKLLLEDRFPGKIAKVETYSMTIPEDDEPFGVSVMRYGKDSRVGRLGMKPIFTTRGLIDGIAFHFEYEWERAPDEMIYEVIEKVAECSEQSSQSEQ